VVYEREMMPMATQAVGMAPNVRGLPVDDAMYRRVVQERETAPPMPDSLAGAIELARAQVTYLEEVANNFEKRLEPFRRPMPPGNATAARGGPEPSVSPLACAIIDLARRIEATSNRLAALSGSLDV
jgi:hypothetical protein